jgi:TPP-dependent pyruvate/acetoin dehydrogenase alpha subunit
LLELFSEGKLSGTTHTYVGQEAVAVSVIHHLRDYDIVFSNHRCHGHYLAKENDVSGLFAEIMGRASGACGGRGGSQHIQRRNFYSNGIQGAYMPITVGMALAERERNSDAIVVAFIGDGTWGEGAVYEALNLAGLWKVPLLVVVEDNKYAQSTPQSLTLAGRLIDRPASFGLSCGEIKSNDVHVLLPHFQTLIAKVREEKQTHVEIVHTYRFNPHSKGDDHRPEEEIDAWRRNHDPLDYVRTKIHMDRRMVIEAEIEQILHMAEALASTSEVAALNSEGDVNAVY